MEIGIATIQIRQPNERERLRAALCKCTVSVAAFGRSCQCARQSLSRFGISAAALEKLVKG